MNLFRAISDILRFDRTNWKALALCIFAATIFWIFNALNKEYATNVRFPLQFEYDETRYIPVEPLPPTITLNISGNGWDLLRKSVGLKVPIISLPLDRPVETRKIVASTLAPLISSQIGSLEVKSIVSDTLRLKIEPRISRKIKLSIDLNGITFKDSYGRTSPVVLLPDSILLEGPKSMIENLHDTLVIKLTGNKVSSSFRESVEVSVPNELIKRDPPVVDVMFEVGLMEEIATRIKLKTPRMPWATEVDRDSVLCVFRFPVIEHNRFMSEVSKTFASIDLVELKKGEVKSTLPQLHEVPSFAEPILVDSVKIKKF